MKNIFNRLKKSLVTEPETITNNTVAPTAPQKAAAFMPSTTALREAITAFIIQTLQPYVDEKGIPVAGLHLYIVCNNPEEEAAARVALYMDRPGMFKTAQLERKLLNHFILLDADWFFECQTVKSHQLPGNSIRKENFALQVSRAGEQVSGHYSKAQLEVLAGQGGQKEYVLDPHKQLKFYIGRTGNPQLSSGKIQQNDIVFTGSDEPGFNEITGSANLHVSRNHAYIIYDSKTDHWLLYPDKGGLPENGNKLKVHTGNDTTKWLNIYGISHSLADGDQVELGGEAILRFTLVEDVPVNNNNRYMPKE